MKHTFKILWVLAVFGLANSSMADPFKSVDYLRSIAGSYTVSGMHNDQKDGTGAATYTERVNAITGKYPALWSGDFLFHGVSSMRWDVTYEAERQWNAGALVNIMWHACPPTQGAVCDWDGGVVSHLSDAQWNDLVTDGGYLNGVWKSRIDEIAVHLQYLKSKGVEVLWRPLHEMNQGVFWWAGRTGSNGTRRLYQLTHDYMVNVKGLTNLAWVWDVQDLSTNYADYNPGSNYWDLAALDVYGDGYTNASYYNALLAQSAGKPIGIGESFKVPSAQVLQNQPRMAFFMVWSYGLQQNNTNQEIQNTYYNPRVITRDEMPGWANVVTSSSSSSTGATTYVQAESYSNMSGVIVENTTDTSGGQNVGSLDAGDWLAYNNINIPAAGTYTIAYRVASLAGGARLQFEQAGGGSIFGVVDIPSTGGWQSWTTVYQTVTLNAGVQSFGIKALNAGGNLNWFSITRSGSASSSVSSSVRSSVVSSKSSASSQASSVVSKCSSPVYVNGATYNTGALVQNGGNEYSCTVGGWCTIGGPYAPGSGWAWTNAWSLVRSCK